MRLFFKVLEDHLQIRTKLCGLIPSNKIQFCPNSPSIGFEIDTSQGLTVLVGVILDGAKWGSTKSLDRVVRLGSLVGPSLTSTRAASHASTLDGQSRFTIAFTMRSETTAFPARSEFLRLARTHTLVPLYRPLTADVETPVTAFLRLAADEPECFMLESVEGGENVGRYTFIGIQPYRKMVSRDTAIEITERRKTRQTEGDIFALWKQELDGHIPARVPGLPPFTAGAVGFFSYDVVRQIERLPEQTNRRPGHARRLPDVLR